MKKIKNIMGLRFGRLLVLNPTNKRRGSSVVWSCKCDCGNITETSNGQLTSNKTKSCGCLQRENTSNANLHNIGGQMINEIKVLRMSTKRSNSRKVYCFAICPNCTREWEVQTWNLKSGNSTQCKHCQYEQRASKTATQLLDNLEQHLGFKVIREFQLKNRWFDGFVPELKLLIESDGSHYHSTENQKVNDGYKDKLAKDANYHLIRVHNNSSKDHEKALSIILRFINKEVHI